MAVSTSEFDSITLLVAAFIWYFFDGIHLSNIYRWLSNMVIPLQQRTFDTFDHVDDWHYMDLHDFIKQKKCGISKVTDHASREIRFNRLSRSDASSLVHYYQQCSPKFVQMFQEWLGLPDSALNFILEQHSPLNHRSTDPSNLETLGPISQSLKDLGLIQKYLVY